MVDAIKNDYASAVTLFELNSKENNDKAKKEKELEDARGTLITNLSLAFSRAEKKKYIDSLSSQEQKELIEQILEESKLDSHSVKMLQDKGLSSPVAGVGIIKRIPDYEQRKEEYIKKKLKEAGL